MDRSRARKVYVCNVMTHEGETRDYSVLDHLEAIRSHTRPYKVFDTVLINNGNYSAAAEPLVAERKAKLVRFDHPGLRDYPANIVLEDVINPSYPLRHDSRKLARALMSLLKEHGK
jgi:uncharacterized cofD-like protein